MGFNLESSINGLHLQNEKKIKFYTKYKKVAYQIRFSNNGPSKFFFKVTRNWHNLCPGGVGWGCRSPPHTQSAKVINMLTSLSFFISKSQIPPRQLFYISHSHISLLFSYYKVEICSPKFSQKQSIFKTPSQIVQKLSKTPS